VRDELVEGRVRHCIGVHLRRTLHHVRQGSAHSRRGATGIGVRLRLVVPHPDTHRFGAPGTTKAISSWKPGCVRSKGMRSFSMVRVNAASLLGFSCKDTVRAPRATSVVVVSEVRWQITRLSSGNLWNDEERSLCQPW
jgi:hypothetical protein